jgi:hypothetical protein
MPNSAARRYCNSTARRDITGADASHEQCAESFNRPPPMKVAARLQRRNRPKIRRTNRLRTPSLRPVEEPIADKAEPVEPRQLQADDNKPEQPREMVSAEQQARSSRKSSRSPRSNCRPRSRRLQSRLRKRNRSQSAFNRNRAPPSPKQPSQHGQPPRRLRRAADLLGRIGEVKLSAFWNETSGIRPALNQIMRKAPLTWSSLSTGNEGS